MSYNPVKTPQASSKTKEDFENMLCAIAWLKQYCARTNCEECVVFGTDVQIDSVNVNGFECPITTSLCAPFEWNLDPDKNEIFLDVLVEYADMQLVNLKEPNNAHPFDPTGF